MLIPVTGSLRLFKKQNLTNIDQGRGRGEREEGRVEICYNREFF